jgi:hypothetical protein
MNIDHNNTVIAIIVLEYKHQAFYFQFWITIWELFNLIKEHYISDPSLIKTHNLLDLLLFLIQTFFNNQDNKSN